MANTSDQHLTDEQLLLYADGELSDTTREAARLHLEACWSCRARSDELETVIKMIATVRRDVLLPNVPPPPRSWDGLQPRLAALDAELARPSLWARIGRALVPAPSRPPYPLRWAAGVVLLCILLFALYPRHSVVSAAELLSRAHAVEVSDARRRINLEERRSPDGPVVARRRIEIWQSHGSKMRRVYDEQQRLIAGEWTRAGGARTIYHRGRKPQLATQRPPVALSIDVLWRLEPSASDFTSLVGRVDTATVTQDESRYVVEYRAGSAERAAGVVRASLTLDIQMLHPVEQVVEVQSGGDIHHFRFTETEFTPLSASAIPARAFEPDSELLGEAPVPPPAAKLPASPAPPTPGFSAAELAALELDALAKLDEAGALLGEQVTLERAAGGGLRIDALVETDARKHELLRALEPLGPNPAITIDISTVAEAQERRTQSQGRVVVRSIEVSKKPVPVHDDLHRYFLSQRSDERWVNEEISRFTVKVLNRSLQARLHARALTVIAARFTPDDLLALSPQRLEAWHSLIRNNARAFQRETESLRRELQPIFFPMPPPDPDGKDEEMSVSGDRDFGRAAARLFELGSAHDVTIGRAFSISAEESKPELVKSEQFWRSLRAAERLSSNIQSATARPATR